MRTFQMRLPSRSIASLLVLWLAFLPNVSNGEDEAGSFALLLESIESSNDPRVQAALLQGMLVGLEGRRNVPAPRGWSRLSEQLALSTDAVVRDRSSALSQIFGDEAAVKRAIEAVKDSALDVGQRRSALLSLLNQQNRESSLLLESLIDDDALSLDAIRGYAILENKEAPSILLSRYSKLSSPQRRAVIETLSSRRVYAEALLKAIQQGYVSTDVIPTQVARSLAEMLGERFTEEFGPIRAVAEDRARLLAKYKKLCSPDAIAAA
ncbi:MAG: hypothetical protein AAGJ83_03380, partial [Planctomycetota bacterium]